MNRKNKEKRIWFLFLRALLVIVLVLLALTCLWQLGVIEISEGVPAAQMADIIFSY